MNSGWPLEFLRNLPWLELGANAINFLSIWLATRNSIHTWWAGIAGCALFAWLFFSARLYADVTLQMFFVGTSALGWWQWLHLGGQRAVRPVTRASRRLLAGLMLAGIICAGGYGLLLRQFTNAYAPFADSALLALSVAAQLLLMQRKLETWIFWLLANTVAIPLYVSRELWLTAFFYALFWANAFLGFRGWRTAVGSPGNASPSVA